MRILKTIIAFFLKKIYRIRIVGIENYHKAGNRVLIIANHSSFIDPIILASCLPDKLTFAVNTYVAKSWLLRIMSSVVDLFPMDPANPLSSKSLIRYLEQDKRAVIFPEGRITVTGSLMKIYNGTGFIADKSGAEVLPIRIDGVQFSPFSRLKGRVKTRWFPPVTVTILPPRKVSAGEDVKGRARRLYAGKILSDIMVEMMYRTSNTDRTLFQALVDARSINGGKHPIIEDVKRKPMNYNELITASFVLGSTLSAVTHDKERVGWLLPNMNSSMTTFFALQAYGRVPAMLNYTVGASGMVSSCQAANIKTIITSRQFVNLAKLQDVIDVLKKGFIIHYLEDVAKQIGLRHKVSGWIKARFATSYYRYSSRCVRADDPAVVLFTSGSEGKPKGVVLSHKNLMSNREQLAARVDFTSQDIVLNAMPMFHSFGLTAGSLLPVLSGIKTFFYPSPLHYRIIPELAYDINATIMFGTNTFLAGYARYAHPYDFYSIRYVFSGAEKLHEETKRTWAEKFGVRIFEGYGATETSPVLAANTPMENKSGSVGQFLPAIESRLIKVPGVDVGGQLHVKGPNIMLGYYLHEKPGVLVRPSSECGEGWYDTGDIVDIDEDGYVSIKGRVKRFAKIGGEMVSLALVEVLAKKTWPESMHAAISIPDKQKGEVIILLTEQTEADRSDLQKMAKSMSLGEINIPRKVMHVKEIPLLATGKTNYPEVTNIASCQN